MLIESDANSALEMFNMPSTTVKHWNSTYADCGVLVKEIASLIHLRDLTATPVFVSSSPEVHRSIAERWIAAIELMLDLVDTAKQPGGVDEVQLQEMTALLCTCREALVAVHAYVLKVCETGEFDSLRRYMAAAVARETA